VIVETTNAIYAIKLLEELQKIGIDADELRLKAGILAWELETQDALLLNEKYYRLVELALQAPGVPYDLGFRVGENTEVREHGVMGYAILNSRDLRECMDRYIKYLPLTGPVMDVSLLESRGNITLRAEPLIGQWAINERTLRYFTQEWLASLNPWGEMIGLHRGLFTEVRIGYQAHGKESTYRHHLAGHVSFGNKITEAEFPKHYLDIPFTYASGAIGEICEAQCKKLMADLEEHHGWAAEVYQKLSRLPYIPGMSEMADQLFTSRRTLRRRLEKEGTTYQQLVIDFRMSMARQYLTETKIPINDVADLIGYSNAANFYRTFQQIEKITPQQYRVRHSN
jgi:AraC-like DNA-binding protein